MSRNATFVQALADATQRPVEVSPVVEATTVGAAFLAGLAVGMWGGWDDIAATLESSSGREPGDGSWIETAGGKRSNDRGAGTATCHPWTSDTGHNPAPCVESPESRSPPPLWWSRRADRATDQRSRQRIRPRPARARPKRRPGLRPTTRPAPPPGTVEIVDFTFSPRELTVATGETVTWRNDDPYAHWVVSTTPDVLDSGELSQAQAYNKTFSQAGTYDYYCNIHNYMKASVTVQ